MKINILGIMHPTFGNYMSKVDTKGLVQDDFSLEPIDDETYLEMLKYEPERAKQLNHIKKQNLQDIARQFCGTIGGECYSSDGMSTLYKQPAEKAFSRFNNCAKSGHLSVAGHFDVVVEFDGIPKALCMLLNNNHLNNTSEQSGRYTNMEEAGTQLDRDLYKKWRPRFIEKFTNTYGQKYPKIFTPEVIEKKANENARYPISSYVKTRMVYRNDIREFTTISRSIDYILAQDDKMHPFYKKMENELREFNEKLKTSGLVFDEFNMIPKDNFGLLSENNKIITPYYGDVIADTYKMSMASVAQKHRGRYDDISIVFDENPDYFVPPIIEDDKKLKKEFIDDCRRNEEAIPQGTLVNVNEIIPTKLITKIYHERLCNAAQVEICNSCMEQIKRILANIDPRVEGVREKLERINGARCTWEEGFKCNKPCSFIEGINCTRKV